VSPLSKKDPGARGNRLFTAICAWPVACAMPVRNRAKISLRIVYSATCRSAPRAWSTSECQNRPSASGFLKSPVSRVLLQPPERTRRGWWRLHRQLRAPCRSAWSTQFCCSSLPNPTRQPRAAAASETDQETIWGKSIRCELTRVRMNSSLSCPHPPLWWWPGPRPRHSSPSPLRPFRTRITLFL
jgi:hypothetical protein